MKNENGFTLVEVLASLVIITIILLSFSRIFIQNNDHANLNTEKLVAIHLADAYLERLRIEGKKVVPNSANNIFKTSMLMNKKTYPIDVKVVSDTENGLPLQNIVVTVSTSDERSHATVEGYIAYD